MNLNSLNTPAGKLLAGVFILLMTAAVGAVLWLSLAVEDYSSSMRLSVDSEGHVYVSDALFHNVQIFTADGKVALFFSRLGVGPGELQAPAGMAFGPDNRLYVADQLNHRIQVFQYIPQPD